MQNAVRKMWHVPLIGQAEIVAFDRRRSLKLSFNVGLVIGAEVVFIACEEERNTMLTERGIAREWSSVDCNEWATPEVLQQHGQDDLTSAGTCNYEFWYNFERFDRVAYARCKTEQAAS